MKVVFFGTPEFAASILECLLQHGIDIVAIVTKPDKPQGRYLKLQPPAVKTLALERCPQIPIYQPIKVSTSEYEHILSSYHADLFIVVAYGEIIKQNILSLPHMGCVNIHASLLPKYRGAAPIHRAIMNGEKETGITIMEMVLALDAGDILHVEKVAIGKNETVADVESHLKILACRAIIKTIENFVEGSIKKVQQKHEMATYAHKITTEECQIKWNQDSTSIHNHIRGTTPYPGSWTLVKIGFDVKRLKIKKSLNRLELQGAPGAILQYHEDSFIVAAKVGAIEILEVQLEGKKATSSSEFIKGYPRIEILNNQ